MSKQLTCERCGQKTDAGAWIGFVYVGAECMTAEDREYVEPEEKETCPECGNEAVACRHNFGFVARAGRAPGA